MYGKHVRSHQLKAGIRSYPKQDKVDDVIKQQARTESRHARLWVVACCASCCARTHHTTIDWIACSCAN
jgi:hypothetical protein